MVPGELIFVTKMHDTGRLADKRHLEIGAEAGTQNRAAAPTVGTARGPGRQVEFVGAVGLQLDGQPAIPAGYEAPVS